MQDSVVQAYEGFGAFEKAEPDLRAMMRLWPNYVQLVTVASTGIKSVEDLKGKRVGIGAPNSGVELNARMIYEAYGMTYEDSDVDYLSYGEAIDQMKNGQCDAGIRYLRSSERNRQRAGIQLRYGDRSDRRRRQR